MCLLTGSVIPHPLRPSFNHWYTYNTVDLPKTGSILNTSSFCSIKCCLGSQFFYFFTNYQSSFSVIGLYIQEAEVAFAPNHFFKSISMFQSSLSRCGISVSFSSSMLLLSLQFPCPDCSPQTLLLPSLGSTLCLPKPSLISNRAALKRPSELQASGWVSWRCHLHHKPAPPTVALLSSCEAFYIMCASGPLCSVFYLLQPLHGEKRALFVCLELDWQLRATLNHFYAYWVWATARLNIN